VDKEKSLLSGDLGTIKSIEEVSGYTVRPIGPMEGSRGSRAGFSQMISALSGHTSMEGFRVETDKHVFLVLIDDQSSCCESWGHVHSADRLEDFVGAALSEVRLTDTALNTTIIERHGHAKYGFDGGGIQPMDFVTDRGKLQLAVYSSQNGYYVCCALPPYRNAGADRALPGGPRFVSRGG